MDRAPVENGMPVSAINKTMGNGHNGDLAVCLTTVDGSGIPTRVRVRPRPAGLQRKFFDTGTWVWRLCRQARSIFSRAEGGGSHTGSNCLTNDKVRQFQAGKVVYYMRA